MTTTWPTTKGLKPALDADAVRQHLKQALPPIWGARVDQRMLDLGFNNAQVAAMADTTPQTISKVRRGDIIPRDYLRITIAAALRTSPEKLFPMPSMAEIARAA